MGEHRRRELSGSTNTHKMAKLKKAERACARLSLPVQIHDSTKQGTYIGGDRLAELNERMLAIAEGWGDKPLPKPASERKAVFSRYIGVFA